MNLEDIAKEAGVSRSTVSRVINNDGYVSKETRARVLEIVERLNFSPNHAARTLVTQRSNVISVVISTVEVFFGDNSYFPMLLQGIAKAANDHDYGILLWLGQTGEDPEHFSQRILRNRMTDGLILASIAYDNPLFERLAHSIPHFVPVERPLIFEDIVSYVTIDNLKAGQIATEHLINLGYQRIAHITGRMTIADAIDRFNGYRLALEKAGKPYDEKLVVYADFDDPSGYQAMQTLIHQKPDAIFIASDTAAIGAMRFIHESGLRVPEDIAIVGFDDLDVAEKSNPPLTTIRQPVQEKGAAAVNLLLDLINETKKSPSQVILPIQLVIRESCGAKKLTVSI